MKTSFASYTLTQLVSLFIMALAALMVVVVVVVLTIQQLPIPSYVFVVGSALFGFASNSLGVHTGMNVPESKI